MKEIWKKIPGYMSRYRVSNLGRLKTVGMWKKDIRGRLLHYKPKLLKQADGEGNTKIANIQKSDGKYHTRAIHHLVLIAFVGPRPKGMECCHWDGNPKNNNLTNLRWDTHSSNERDKVRHGTSNQGTRNRSAKLDEIKVRKIRKLHKTGKYSLSMLCRRFKIKSLMTMHSVVHRKTWKHVGG